MRHLPYTDPGRPDVRSPARYLLWTGARQWRTLLLGMLFGVVWMVAQALVPAAIGRGLDAGVAPQDLGAALRWSLVVLALALIQAVAGVMRHRTAVDNWLRASFRAMQLLGRHSAEVGVAVRRKLPTGEVVSAATNDALYVGGVFDVSARFAGSVVSSVVVAALVLQTSVLLGVIVLVGVPLMVLTMGPVMRPLHHRQQVQREVAGRLTALGADTVAGLRVLRGVGGESAFFDRYRRRSDELRDAGVRVSGLQASLDAAQVLLPGAFLVVFTWLGARLALRGDLSAGDIVAFYGYAFFLVVPIRTAVETADRLTRSLVGARRIIAVLRTEPEIADREGSGPTTLPASGSTLVEPGSGLVVEPGRMLGLVSADPDSTAAVAHRLGRLTPDAETVLGGVPLELLPVAAVRERITVSEAEPRLFTGRLRDELDLRDRADDAALLAALHVAAAEDVLDALPDGLDSPVEEGGRGFSGGQRQRLALARVLLSDAEVLVLVEPTSAVDAHTEALVAERLHDWRHGTEDDGGGPDPRRRSTVVTSTSPLVLDRCDEVAFLVDGRVVARGRHRDLLRDDPAYRDTVTRGEEL